MSALEISQMAYNITVSLAVLFLTVLLGVFLFNLIKLARSVKETFLNLDRESTQLYAKAKYFFENSAWVNLFSKVFKKDKK